MQFLQYVLPCIVLLSAHTAFSQTSLNTETANSEPKFKKISVEDGLSQSTVYCILQDKDGFMWFGTRGGGLNKYDGYNFTVYKNNPNDSTSLGNNEVISLLQDHAGQLWVGTRKGGLNKFNPSTEGFQQYKTTSSNSSISGNTVNAIFEDSKQRLWIGTSNGLDIYSKGIFLHNQIPGIKNQHITAIDEDKEGKLYITDKNGLFIHNPENDSTTYVVNEDILLESRGSNYSIPVLVDSKGKIWVGSSLGIRILNDSLQLSGFKQNHSSIESPKSETRDIIEDSKGNIWIGTIHGLYKYNPKSESLEFYQKNENNEKSLSHNSIYSIYEDRSGIIWIGTWGGGVNLLSDKLWKFEHYRHQSNNSRSLSNNVVSSFEEDEKGLWIGTELGGLNYMPYNSKEFFCYAQGSDKEMKFASNHIKTLYHDSDNNLWIGTFGAGLNLFNKTKKTYKQYLPKSKVFSISEGPDGHLWVGTLYGLYKYNRQTNTWKLFQNDPNDKTSLSHNFVDVLYLSQNNTLWVGTKEAGLMKYLPESESFQRYPHIAYDSTSILSNYIISITEDKNGNILIGTNNGINIFNPIHQNFVEVKIEELPDKFINGIICDKENNYWISTNKGITFFSQEGKTINYDLKDGLQSNEFNRGAYFKSKRGMFYFGGINGFNAFTPETIKENNIIPRIIITDFKLSYHSVNTETEKSPLKTPIEDTKEIVLDHDQSDFSFEFVALNYISPEKNQYAYKLVGYNNDWIYAGTNRNATYTNIKPGTYIFMVKGANNDNVWNEEGVSINIRINPPFWKTPYAYILYVIVLSLLLLLFRKIISNRIEDQNKLRNERLEKKRIEELNQLKLRFFTNISHEFRTPLTLISGPLSKIATYHTDNEEQKYLIRIVQNNVKRLLILVNELMDFRKAENEKFNLRVANTNIADFIEYIIECFSENTTDQNINLEFNYQLNNKSDFWFDQNIIDKVIFNLLSNAIKYTNEGESIQVTLNIKDDKAIIEIQDHGVGIPKDKLEKIFDRFYQIDKQNKTTISGTGIGLAFVKRLIEVHRGQIHVESEINQGTSFFVTIPINKDAYSTNELVENEGFLKNESSNHLQVYTISPPEKEIIEPVSKNKILIVEDNDELRNFLRTHFSNFKIISAVNGKEGVDIANKEIPDIIISDIMMPEMDGLEMCKHLKSQLATSHIPLILLTAKTEMSQKIEGLELGADAYIEKPFDINHLSLTVNNILNQRKALRKKFSEEPDIELDELDFSIHEKRFIEKVNSYIEKNISNPDLSVEMLALELGLSRSQLFRKIRSVFSTSPSEIIRVERLKYSKKVLLDLNHNINEVADLVGFKSTPYFITSFKKYYGITPNDYLQSVIKKTKK